MSCIDFLNKFFLINKITAGHENSIKSYCGRGKIIRKITLNNVFHHLTFLTDILIVFINSNGRERIEGGRD